MGTSLEEYRHNRHRHCSLNSISVKSHGEFHWTAKLHNLCLYKICSIYPRRVSLLVNISAQTQLFKLLYVLLISLKFHSYTLVSI